MAGLIVAVGPQNAFVLRQGLVASRRTIALVVGLCALADVTLIALGVAGMGALIAGLPWLLWTIRYVGAAFLLGYGILAVRRATRSEALIVAESTEAAPQRLGQVLAATAAFTFLNPNVYLDTVMLVGGLANQHPDGWRWVWAAGAMSMSVIWFAALGFGARLLRPAFAKAITWRVFDSVVAVVMFAVALSLLLP